MWCSASRPPRSAWFSDLPPARHGWRRPDRVLKSVRRREERRGTAHVRPVVSALLVDGDLRSVDRDLLDEAVRSGVAVFVVADPRVMPDWDALGATAVASRVTSASRT